jgi:hypothetical protein
MDSITIGFSRPKGGFQPFSWLIRLVTWSPYSHAYVRYYDTYTDRWIVFQASGLKVNFIGDTMFDGLEDIYAEFVVPISDSTKQSVVQGAIDKCGSPYGVGQVVGFAWVLFMRLFGKNVKNPFYSASSFVCSELVGDVLVEINDGTFDPSTMTPKDVYNFVVSKGFKPVSAQPT